MRLLDAMRGTRFALTADLSHWVRSRDAEFSRHDDAKALMRRVV